MGGQKVFVCNGRLTPTEVPEPGKQGKLLPGWSLVRNGFCLLTDQSLPLAQADFDKTPGQFISPCLFRFAGGSEAEHVAADAPAARVAPTPFLAYYKHMAEAAKVAFPEAEYVVVNGHIAFSAEVSPLKQVGVLLGRMAKAALSSLLFKLLPCCAPLEPAEPDSGKQVPPFGATEWLHVDASAQELAGRLERLLGPGEPGGRSQHWAGAQKLRLPGKFLSGAKGKRRVTSINMWRNQRAHAVIKSHHLAVLDAQSISEQELHAAKFKNYAIGGQEQYHLGKLQEGHRLVYFPDMAQSEILVFKQGAYVVEPGPVDGEYRATPAADAHTNFVFHTSFVDPTAPKDALARKSVVCAGVLIIMPETETD